MAKHTAAATEEQAEEAEALALAAGAAAQLVVEGQAEGEPGHGLMGRYELVEGKVVNGRGVWERKGKRGWFKRSTSAYLYWRSSEGGDWNIGSESEMEDGEVGDIKWADGGLALTPVGEVHAEAAAAAAAGGGGGGAAAAN